MSTYIKGIEKLIEEAVTEKTFSLKSVTRIKKLMKNYKEQVEINKNKTETIENRDERIKSLERGITELNTQVAKSQTKINKQKTRVKDLKKRELKMDLLDQKVLNSAERRIDVISMFNTVFRNTIVRETVQKTVPVLHPASDGDQYGNNKSGEFVEDRAVTENKEVVETTEVEEN